MTGRKELLPPLFKCSDGSEVTNTIDWEEKRRPEIVELFRKYVYGREPVQQLAHLHFQVHSRKPMMNGRAHRKIVTIQFSGPGGDASFHTTIFIPTYVKKPVPVFLLLNYLDKKWADPERKNRTEFFPAERIVERGFAAAVLQLEEVDPDFHDGFQNGVHGIFDPSGRKREGDAWGTISAWAWGASRVMDYIVEDPDLDEEAVIIVGHSRGGKTALWAGALDERFAMVVSNNSGCTGAAISRGKKGETIRNINTAFPHWFCENYKRFNDREYELPVDQHMLLALIAPRLLYVAGASEDEWADPESELLSLTVAEAVYHLYGYKGTELKQLPPANTPFFGERTGFHLREGDHDLTLFDWDCFMDFWEEKGQRKRT